MTTTYAVIPQVCPGSKRMPKHYRADYYHGAMPNQQGQCPSCGEWAPVDWHGADPSVGWRTIVSHEVRR